MLKVISESALHKSDVGGVVLGVEGDAEVKRADQSVTAAFDDVAAPSSRSSCQVDTRS